ncbi:DUF2807 domain-containing protein [Pleomorphomonas diazotrophica]|uniref:DUF2807 domain-containing protein n=1 Tax=Pleomorphomonas diazotrophica TaxID=1166257 RepID=A0A1I4V4B2_9HYPH|nr:DUF2807 domain-containing protein [Pleomorphomonas diazotrophica]PKR88732.1 DUF2807 domain-containing protein [Pleomorphomonas diazotrophica]SFM95820.1 Putative auto-transporter adhesin, head GIN domain [Pleomorphomonas diazotrophica]
MMGKLATVATAGLAGGLALLVAGIGLSGHGLAGARKLWGALPSACGGATSTRSEVTLPFTPGDSLQINLPASVSYRPGDKAEAIVRGDPALIEHVRMDGRRLTLDCDPGWRASSFEVAVSGPAIAEWKMLGSGDLMLTDIKQPQLTLSIMGSADIAATGAAGVVSVNIMGSGSAHLKGLTAKSAEITIRGSGDAEVNAQGEADVSISGSGNVELAGRPVLRRSEIMGSGRITQVE